MTKKNKGKKNPIKELGNVGIGVAKASVAIGTGAAITGRVSQTIPQVASISGVFPILATGVRLSSTIKTGGIVLNSLKNPPFSSKMKGSKGSFKYEDKTGIFKRGK